MLREFQSTFRHSLLEDKGTDVTVFIRATKTRDAEVRFDVHRNNMRVSLVEVMRAAFPAVNFFTGADNFSYAAGRFIQTCPPLIPRLLAYGDQFPNFLRDFAPARSMSWLVDLAQLEWGCQESLFAPDADALRIEDLSQLAEQSGPIHLMLHPSLRMISSAYPVLSLWEQAMSGDNDDERVPNLENRGEVILLVRPQDDVEFHSLQPGEAALLAAVAAGKDLAEALEDAAKVQPGQDLGYILAVLVARNCFMPPPVSKT